MDKKLDDLQVGDVVAVIGMNSRGLSPVTKITATQITVGGKRYKKSNGNAIGEGSYIRTNIVPATSALIAEIKTENHRKRLLKILQQSNWETFCNDRLQAIYDFVFQAGPYPSRRDWVVDECPDAHGQWTIRLSDGSPNGDTSVEPIATVYEHEDAQQIVALHNGSVEFHRI